ncbi:MAG TPA: thiolase family protein [Pseudonocardiaceae bacterium]
MRDVYVAGIAMTRFAKQPERTLKDLTAEAVTGAIKDAGRVPADVRAAYVGNAVAGTITGQEMVLGQVVLRPLGIGEIPVINVENACASAATAFHLAWQAVATGLHDVVLAVGVEKMTHPDKARSFAAIGGSVDMDAVPPDLPEGRSFLMDLYASAAIDYMRQSGATVEDFARVVVKNQHNGGLNPAAQYGNSLTVQDVLNARMIVKPFTLPMCSPISDGAAAALLVSAEFQNATSTRGLGGGAPPVTVLASTLCSAPADGSTSVTGLASSAAYDITGLGAADLDCIEVHDAAASAELTLCEQIGLAPPGGGPALIRGGHTELGGRVPVNTSGGLLARGHPIGATGLGQIVEIIQQLRGTAGPRQLAQARRGMTQNSGAWHGRDNLVSAVHIFGRG